MTLIHQLAEWVVSFSQGSYATLALFILAFAESSFFPIPPDTLQIPLSLSNIPFSFIFATIALIGSVTGGMFGYFIGNKGGKPILNKLVSKEKIALVEHYYQKYDVWAVGLAGFTPIPYKVFTITAGVFDLDFKRFVLASLLGRGGRFYLVALFIYLFGESVKMYLDKYFNIVVLSFTILLIGGFYLLNLWSKKFVEKKEKPHHHTWKEIDKNI